MTGNDKLHRLRWGMVGGGIGGLIGPVHRMAARLGGRYQMLAGALSSDPAKNHASATQLDIAPDRCYDDFEEMARREGEREDGVEIVSIVLPNHLHYRATRAFLSSGIHVICDKPLCTTQEEANELVVLAASVQRLLGITYVYTGYPMVRRARNLVLSGLLGKIRSVQVEYVQGWLSQPLEKAGHKQASWRTDPVRGGAAGCLGDIGSHAFHLAEFVSGERVSHLLSDIGHHVPGRELDDEVRCLLRFSNQARGGLWATQIAAGQQNGLTLHISGERGSLAWEQEQPESLFYHRLDAPAYVLRRGGPKLQGEVDIFDRLPAGHPEGFIEAFGTLYDDFADLVRSDVSLISDQPSTLAPLGEQGARGVSFVHAALRSNAAEQAWMVIE